MIALSGMGCKFLPFILRYITAGHQRQIALRGTLRSAFLCCGTFQALYEGLLFPVAIQRGLANLAIQQVPDNRGRPPPTSLRSRPRTTVRHRSPLELNVPRCSSRYFLFHDRARSTRHVRTNMVNRRIQLSTPLPRARYQRRSPASAQVTAPGLRYIRASFTWLGREWKAISVFTGPPSTAKPGLPSTRYVVWPAASARRWQPLAHHFTRSGRANSEIRPSTVA